MGIVETNQPGYTFVRGQKLVKLKDKEIVDSFTASYKVDHDISIKRILRREAISIIGEQRNGNNIDFLIETLKEDNDPQVVCRAIRALLVFKGNARVDEALKKLVNHENEMIKQVIEKEFFSKAVSEKKMKPHAEIDRKLSNLVVLGDVLDVLKSIDGESVHLTFTSPPYYNARDYSIYSSYESYLGFLRRVFEETCRITKEGRFFVVNTSPVIMPRISRTHSSKRYPIPFDLHAILMRMDWEFIDDIVWEKPEQSVKNRVGGFQQHRKPLAYKPNSVTEYLMVYRKKTNKLLDWNIRQYEFDTVKESKVQDGFETTNVWRIRPRSDKIHSAVFPIELCKRIISYYSFKGDLVFDPFAGIGTVGLTAQALGRKFFLTEKEPKYFEYMKRLIVQNSLFDEDLSKFLTLEEFNKE